MSLSPGIKMGLWLKSVTSPNGKNQSWLFKTKSRLGNSELPRNKASVFKVSHWLSGQVCSPQAFSLPTYLLMISNMKLIANPIDRATVLALPSRLGWWQLASQKDKPRHPSVLQGVFFCFCLFVCSCLSQKCDMEELIKFELWGGEKRYVENSWENM